MDGAVSNYASHCLMSLRIVHDNPGNTFYEAVARSVNRFRVDEQ